MMLRCRPTRVQGNSGIDRDCGCGCSLQNARKTSTVDRLDLYARTPQAAGGTVPGDDCV